MTSLRRDPRVSPKYEPACACRNAVIIRGAALLPRKRIEWFSSLLEEAEKGYTSSIDFILYKILNEGHSRSSGIVEMQKSGSNDIDMVRRTDTGNSKPEAGIGSKHLYINNVLGSTYFHNPFDLV
jgi:hypothetical protein